MTSETKLTYEVAPYNGEQYFVVREVSADNRLVAKFVRRAEAETFCRNNNARSSLLIEIERLREALKKIVEAECSDGLEEEHATCEGKMAAIAHEALYGDKKK